MKTFSFNGKSDDLIFIEDGFTFPSMSKQVQYHNSEHSNYRRRLRATREPFSFPLPIFAFRKGIDRQELNERLNDLLYSDGPAELEIEGLNWYLIGEFNGPYEIPNIVNGLTSFELEFTSTFSHKFYDGTRTQTTSNKRATINSKTQIPTVPLIELTGLTGDDVQVSISGEDFRRIRLSGNLPANLTIDIENERIYETNSGLNRLNLLRIDSAFEDFKINNGDVVVLKNAGSNASAKLTYKELLL